LIFFAFTDYDDAIHIYCVEKIAHRVDSGTIGSIFVATPNPL
jgi:hypothetical protein